MTRIDIKLLVMPDEIEKKHQDPKKKLEQKIREWIDDVNDGPESKHPWQMLRRIFNKLANEKNRCPCHEKWFRMIAPVMERWGLHDPNRINLRAEDLPIITGEDFEE